MLRRTIARLFIGAAALTGSACYHLDAVPSQHIVMIDSYGRLMDPTGNIFCNPKMEEADRNRKVEEANRKWLEKLRQKKPKDAEGIRLPGHYSWNPCNGKFSTLFMRPLTQEVGHDASGIPIVEGDQYLDDVFKAMDDYYAAKADGVQRRKIVFIVHGGLNTNKLTIGRARELAQKVIESDPDAYPIFINWQSNLWRALLEHSVALRQGDHIGYRKGWGSMPFYLAADVARGLGRAPIIWWYSLRNDGDRIARAFSKLRGRGNSPSGRLADRFNARISDERRRCEASGVCDAVDVETGPSDYHWRDFGKSTATYVTLGLTPTRLLLRVVGVSVGGWVTWLPAKYLSEPILDGLGSAAWEDMKRHAILGFGGDRGSNAFMEYADKDGTIREPDVTGGISTFFRRFTDRVNATRCSPSQPAKDCVQWDITLIAHSMGAIVSNQIVHNFEDLDIDRIIYMAAACSVREYEDAVIPYMSRHPRTEMYHVTLDPFSEVRERHVAELPPSGSLLVWVDNFFTQPVTMRDRTAGRFENLIRFIGDTPRGMRRRVHLKAFPLQAGVNADRLPQDHGDFFSKEFWKASFYEPKHAPAPKAAEAGALEPF